MKILNDKRFSDRKEMEKYAREKGYKWRSDNDLIFGGYFVNEEGEVLFPDEELVEIKTSSKELKDKTENEIAKEIEDLGGRLYYCSDTGEGRKMRREIENKIRQLERERERRKGQFIEEKAKEIVYPEGKEEETGKGYTGLAQPGVWVEPRATLDINNQKTIDSVIDEYVKKVPKDKTDKDKYKKELIDKTVKFDRDKKEIKYKFGDRITLKIDKANKGTFLFIQDSKPADIDALILFDKPQIEKERVLEVNPTEIIKLDEKVTEEQLEEAKEAMKEWKKKHKKYEKGFDEKVEQVIENNDIDKPKKESNLEIIALSEDEAKRQAAEEGAKDSAKQFFVEETSKGSGVWIVKSKPK
jgi:hypothetical protein